MAGRKGAARILVLCGGPSEEREISLLSGQAVAKACKELGYDVIVSDIGPEDLSPLDEAFDIVFPVLHGSFGEDGQLQKQLESRGVQFIGSGSHASAVAFDKARAKQAFADAGGPTPNSIVTVGAVEALPLGGRFCCKPSCQGSSIGIEFACSLEEVNQAIARIHNKFGGEVIVEEFAEGRELTVGILGDSPLPIVEIKSANSFYDFEAKYRQNDTEYLCPADMPESSALKIQELALQAFACHGCRDFGRADLILTSESEPYFLEVNTIPGFTEKSLLPKAALEAGIEFNQLVERLIVNALARN